jgi:hypothetical protein
MLSPQTLMKRSIAQAIRGTKPRTDQRMKALAHVRWVLATEDGQFVAVNESALATLTREPAKAAIYDGRDNETIKVGFFEALLKTPLMVVILDS